jgi:hypothetical protein
MSSVKPLKFLLPVAGLCTLLVGADPGWAASCRSERGRCVTPAVSGRAFSLTSTADGVANLPAYGRSTLIDAPTGRFIAIYNFAERLGPRAIRFGGRTRSLKCAVEALNFSRVSCTLTRLRG